MKNHRIPAWTPLFLALFLAGAYGASFHLELLESMPGEDASLASSPEEVWLKFNEPPDMSRTSFSIRGPDGSVELDSIRSSSEDPDVVRAKVLGAMPEGSYTVSWLAAPTDDHGVRGRYSFTIGQGR